MKLKLKTWRNDINNNTLTCDNDEISKIRSEFFKMNLTLNPIRRIEMDTYRDIFNLLINNGIVEIPNEVREKADEISSNIDFPDVDEFMIVVSEMLNFLPLNELLTLIYKKEVSEDEYLQQVTKEAREGFTGKILRNLWSY